MNINTDYSYYNSSYYTQQTTKKQKLSLSSLIDSNEDKTLGADELSDFAAEFNKKTGNTLELSTIMTQYDTNGDGELDESEQEAMNKEKALEKLMASSMPIQMRMMDEAAQPKSGAISSDEDDEKIYKITEELRKFIEERFARKEEEETITKDAVTKAKEIKLALQRRLSQSVSTYEKSFWFENTYAETAQYGA